MIPFIILKTHYQALKSQIQARIKRVVKHDQIKWVCEDLSVACFT